MKMAKLLEAVVRGLVRFNLVLLLVQPLRVAASLEQTFDLLQIGTTTYRNVTVTTKNKNYIFILHSKGMTNIRVADLPSEVKSTLGYEDPAAQAKTNAPAAWARQTLAKIKTPQVARFQQQLAGLGHLGLSADKLQLPQLDQKFLLIGAIALFALYLLHCYCCLLICRKAGHEPGALIWIPFFQLIPLLKAATMSPWWVLGFLVPGLNLVAQILWCVKITQARGKTLFVALLLIFPLSSPFAAFYLAFSGGRRDRKRKDDRRIEIMTLEAA
jgi:hypothetical protein